MSQPGVQKALESSLIQKNIFRFKTFLSSVFLTALNKWTSTIKKYLKWSNLILINLVVISYHAGEANATTLTEWLDVFCDFDVWWGYQIVINVFYISARFLGNIIVFCLKITFTVFVLYGIYRLYKKIKKCFEPSIVKESNCNRAT